eukprot:2415227-Amphidinium_carterae.1
MRPTWILLPAGSQLLHHQVGDCELARRSDQLVGVFMTPDQFTDMAMMKTYPGDDFTGFPEDAQLSSRGGWKAETPGPANHSGV